MERWLPAPGYEGAYEVSDMGRVRSLDRVTATATGPRTQRGRVMKLRRRSDNHLQVNLTLDGRASCWLVHRLVMLAFAGEPQPGQEVCHNNGDGLDNRLENLRWDTRAANVADKFRHNAVYQTKITSCPHGHDYTPENTYNSRDGKRSCKTCRRASFRRWAQRQREQAA